MATLPPMPPSLVAIAASDGTVLAADIHLPDGDGPFATVLSSCTSPAAPLPYADELLAGGFAVVRMHRRGTGASAGTSPSDLGVVARSDLGDAAAWVAAQPWSSGAVGVIGTGAAATDALLVAAGPAAGELVRAVVAVGPTDDAYSDGEVFAGGVLRGLDLFDRPLADVVDGAAPPDPGSWATLHGTAWDDEWRRRIDALSPALLERLTHPLPDDSWLAGSLRHGPLGAGYERVACPVLVVTGWAGAHPSVVGRVMEFMPKWRVIAGPWGDGDPSCTAPGPTIDIAREIVRTFDQHLRGGPQATQRRGQLFVRTPARPAHDLDAVDGWWFESNTWPMNQVKEEPRRTRADKDEVDETVVVGDVGVAAWRAGSSRLPWGQPLDQLPDNARSVTYDWLHPSDMVVVGLPELTVQVRSSEPYGQVSAKLCDIAPDGTSTLITRSVLDLRHRGVFPSDAFGEVGAELSPVVPGEWIDLHLQFGAIAWTLRAGHRLRLAIAGTDWPHCWPPAGPFTLGVRRGSVRLVLWSAKDLPPARDEFAPGRAPELGGGDGVEWRHEHDVLRGETRVHARTDDGLECSLGVDVTRLERSWATGTRRAERSVDGRRVVTAATLDVRADATGFDVDLTVRATLDDSEFATRRWHHRLPR